MIPMVQRTRLIECPNCGKQLEDTKQERLTCRFCGFNFVREEVVQEDEEYIRRRMIVDLRTAMDTFKAWKTISIIFMIISFLLAIPVHISVPFGIPQGVVLALFVICGFIFFILMLVFDRKYESSKSKASDLSMRRRL